MTFPRGRHWLWIVLLAGLIVRVDRPAVGGPAKRYMGQPVAGPEADPLSESTLQGIERGLNVSRWPTARPARRDARSASSSAASTSSASESLARTTANSRLAARYLTLGVAALTLSSLLPLGLLLWKRRRDRRAATVYIRYAISQPDRKPRAT